MKKIVIALLILICIYYSINNYKHIVVYANEDFNYYAQIQLPQVYFYENIDGVSLFQIPTTYYVKLLKDSENGYYYAKYLDKFGYVKESDVTCVKNIPPYPYLSNVNFRILGAQSAELRSEPNKSKGIQTLICDLPLYETNFTFYGIKTGEEVVSNRGNIWYYCSYYTGRKYEQGYVYSGLVDMLTEYDYLPLETDTISKHNWSHNNKKTSPKLLIPNTKQLIIVGCITIPICIIIFLLFHPITSKEISNKPYPLQRHKIDLCDNLPPKNNTHIRKRKRQKGKDYYEL